jgi:hypothetical protein
MDDPRSYFKSIWNYIDIIPPIGILVLLIMDFIPDSSYEAEKIV